MVIWGDQPSSILSPSAAFTPVGLDASLPSPRGEGGRGEYVLKGRKAEREKGKTLELAKANPGHACSCVFSCQPLNLGAPGARGRSSSPENIDKQVGVLPLKSAGVALRLTLKDSSRSPKVDEKRGKWFQGANLQGSLMQP